MGLAAEIQAAHAANGTGAAGISGGSSVPQWLPIAIAVPAALCLAAAAAAGFLLLRRRRRAARLVPAKPGVAGEDAAPLTPRSGKMDRMESGELKGKQLGLDEAAAAAAGAVAGAAAGAGAAPFGQHSGGSRGSAGALSDATIASGGGRAPRQAAASLLWRARQAAGRAQGSAGRPAMAVLQASLWADAPAAWAAGGRWLARLPPPSSSASPVLSTWLQVRRGH